MTHQLMVSSLRQLASLVLLGTSTFVTYTESCSRRSTPKPRPPPASYHNLTAGGTSPAVQPQGSCPRPYDTDFCLNGGACFSIQIGDAPPSINCACLAGWTGRRCELKDLPNDYFARQGGSDLKGASLHGGVAVIAIIVVIAIIAAIIISIHWRNRKKPSSVSSSLRRARLIISPTLLPSSLSSRSTSAASSTSKHKALLHHHDTSSCEATDATKTEKVVTSCHHEEKQPHR